MAVPTKDLIAVAETPQALAPIETPDLASQIIALAGNPDLDVAKLEKLIDMQERMLRSQAESAFNGEFATMQGVLPTVIEKAKGDKNMMYAPLEDIVEVIRPILAQHGFSISHRTEWPEKGWVKIVGVLSHRQGHARQSEFLTQADNSGSKNAIQALGSAISYGRRYTTNDLLGIVTRKLDNDGKTAVPVEAVEPPKGFTDWWKRMEVVAEDGLPTLTTFWKESEPAFRDFAFKHRRAAHEELKVKAANISAKAKAAK